MTTCTCDTHTCATSATTLTVSNTGGGQAISVSGASVGTPLCAVYVAGNNSTYGIFSEGTANAILGKTYTNSGKGVFGQAACTTGGVGVYGQANNATGFGVYGDNIGTGASSGVGVYGHSNGYAGVYGVCSTSAGNGVMASGWTGIHATATGPYGLYVSQGDVFIAGYVTKGGGGYRIDHPTDPENKFLNHCFVESPEMMNVYRGRVTLDSNGEATVTLPSYFEAANENPEYILTGIGAAMPNLHVAEEIKDGTFKVSGGVVGKTVSWQISAARSDKWAKANHPGVEIEKKADEKGLFMHPELHGHGDTKSIDPHRRSPARF